MDPNEILWFPVEPRSLWFVSAMGACQAISRATAELTQVAVVNGWYSEGEVVYGLMELSTDMIDCMGCLQYGERHHVISCWLGTEQRWATKLEFSLVLCNSVDRLNSLREVVCTTKN
jgi:hypothetical protein